VRFPPAPAPFTDRITCVGTLCVDEHSTGPLDILIDVSPTAAHGIRGWVLGNKAVADAIEKEQGRHRGALRLAADTGPETLSSESVWIRGTQSFGADREAMPHGLHGIACAFDCLDLTRRFAHKGETPIPREVRFLLRGPRVRGLVGWMHESSFEGSNKVKVLGGGRLATGGDLPFAMFVLAHFLHDCAGSRRDDEDERGRGEAQPTSETHVLAMACRTRKTADEYSDEKFLADARQAVEDMCLLLSFLAGGMITWHAYSQWGPGISVRHNRSLGGTPDVGRSVELVNSWELRDFSRLAFRRLRRLRANGIDLEMPLVSAIAGAQAGIARQRFGEFFLALEALHSLHLESGGRTFLLEKAVFKKVQSAMRASLTGALRAQGLRSLAVRAQMANKLNELNRPPLWDGLQALMKRLRVDWDDLYAAPAPERPTFLKLRNRLFHSHGRAADEEVYKESIRVEAVVHRILLRWLGWEDLWNAPSPEVRHFVSGKGLPDRHRLGGRPRGRRKRR